MKPCKINWLLMILDTEIDTKTTPNPPKGDPKELRFSSLFSASILDRL